MLEQLEKQIQDEEIQVKLQEINLNTDKKNNNNNEENSPNKVEIGEEEDVDTPPSRVYYREDVQGKNAPGNE